MAVGVTIRENILLDGIGMSATLIWKLDAVIERYFSVNLLAVFVYRDMCYSVTRGIDVSPS